MNESKKRDARAWSKWNKSGAVDLLPTAKAMGKAIFGYDPIIGCPFDDADMRLVEAEGALRLGERVTFKGPNKLGTMTFPIRHGRIIAIGAQAKYLNGDPFTALAVQVGSGVFFKTAKEVAPATA